MAASADPKTRQLYEFGPFRLDAEKDLLLRENKTIPIPPKYFQILLVLIRHNKQVVTKGDLLKTVWPDTFVEEANLSQNIFLLRKALGERPHDHQYIVIGPGRRTQRCSGKPLQCRSGDRRAHAMGMDRGRGCASRRSGRRCLETLGPSRTGAYRKRHRRARRLHEFHRRSSL